MITVEEDISRVEFYPDGIKKLKSFQGIIEHESNDKSTWWNYDGTIWLLYNLENNLTEGESLDFGYKI